VLEQYHSMCPVVLFDEEGAVEVAMWKIQPLGYLALSHCASVRT
jgi:hypothetical protein